MGRCASVVVLFAIVGCTTEAIETTEAPAAFAGYDDDVTTGDTVVLDASLSRDPDGDALTYAWKLEAAPEGSTARIELPRAVLTSFVADVAGTYVASLTVSDGLRSSRDLVTYTARAASTTTATASIAIAPASCNVDLRGIARSACGTGAGRIAISATTTGLSNGSSASHHVEWGFFRLPAGALPNELETSTTATGLDDTFGFVPPRPGDYWVSARLAGPEGSDRPALASVAVFDDDVPIEARPRAVLVAPTKVARLSRVFFDGRPSELPSGSGAVVRRWSLLADPSSGADALADLATGCPTDACRILVPTKAGVYIVSLAVETAGVQGASALVAVEVE